VSTYYTMAMDPDGKWNHVDANLNSGLHFSVDATADPALAAKVMAHWDQGSNKSFTLKDGTGDPTYSYLPKERATSMLFNNTLDPATLTLHTGVTHTETTTVTGTIGWKTSLGFMDFANAEINASIAVGHEWSDTNDWGQDEAVTVRPGYVGWIEQVVYTETVHGDFTFTDNDGVTYHVTNFALTQPDQSPRGSHALAIDYSAETRPMTPAELQQYPAGTTAVANPVH
jgi:hypothetical protein